MKNTKGKSAKQAKKNGPQGSRKAAAGKAASKPTAGKQAARAAASSAKPAVKSTPTSPAVEHWTPREIQGIGWKPFRYPPE
jgi:hypothetical protein